MHGSKTVDPVRYTPLVFERLRGLLMCDGLPMPEDKKLTKPEELSALQFLNEVCPVCMWAACDALLIHVCLNVLNRSWAFTPTRSHT